MRFDRDATPDDVAGAIDDVGYAIVEGLADAATMDRSTPEIDELAKRIKPISMASD